jgi:hypothetical protein
MATTTTNFGWDIPQSTDLVKDGATAIAALGQDIDTALIDLKGGTTGQVLAKASGTDLDFSWVAQDDSNAIQNAIVDAKGDLIGATAADTPARLAVGANGTVLTADSAEATGLKWATPSTTVTYVGCALTKNADQSIANNTNTAITFDNETIDTDGFHSTSSNTSRITIPTGKGGKYLLTATLQFNSAGASGGSRRLLIYKNGTSILHITSVPRDGFNSSSASFIVSAVATDYFEVFGFQNSGGAQNVVGYATNAEVPTTFTATLIGA